MKVKIKKLKNNAVIPVKAHATDAGLDLYATDTWMDEYDNVCYGTGLAMEIPEGYVGLLFPRSSVSKYDLQLCNSVGVIDSAYRGEVIFKFSRINKNAAAFSGDFNVYKTGERIGQIIIMPYPEIEFEESEELSETDRGEGGFGSTGVE